MTNLIRQASIAVIVLFAILVLSALGEGLCETCVDGCCVTAERFERLRMALRMILGSLGPGAESRLAVDAALRLVPSVAWPPLPPLALAEVSSLRI
jgi:hypothetical protein